MPEEEAFCVFVRLMQEYRLRELFKPSMAELGLCIYQFEYLLQVKRKQERASKKTINVAVWTLSTKGQQIFLFFFVFLISSTSLIFQACSLRSILVFWDVNFLSCFCFLLTFVISGAASRAECPFPVPEFPHFHVCLILVPHAFSHLSPSSCCHTHLWYFHVWGKKYTKHTKYRKIGYNCGYVPPY